MTIQELYTRIGGSYDHALQIMRSEKLIDRYIMKLQKSPVAESLKEASATMDGGALFDAAHAMKGVCANLGLDGLSAKASELAEEFRPGSTRKMDDAQVKALIDETLALYDQVIEGINVYEQEK